MDIELWKIIGGIILALISIFVWFKIYTYKKTSIKNSYNKTTTKVVQKVKENDWIIIWNINGWK